MRAEMLSMQQTAATKFIPNAAPVAPGEAFQDWAALAVDNAERWIFIAMNDAMGDAISTVPATTQAPGEFAGDGHDTSPSLRRRSIEAPSGVDGRPCASRSSARCNTG